MLQVCHALPRPFMPCHALPVTPKYIPPSIRPSVHPSMPSGSAAVPGAIEFTGLWRVGRAADKQCPSFYRYSSGDASDLKATLNVILTP
jgi:hypothetical protein